MNDYVHFTLITTGLILAGLLGSPYALVFTGVWLFILSVLFIVVVRSDPNTFKEPGDAGMSDVYGYCVLLSMSLVSYTWLFISGIMLIGAVI